MITGELKNKIDGLWDYICGRRTCQSTGSNRTDYIPDVYS